MWTSIPVDPDADTARQWAIDELSKREYKEGSQSWLESFIRWLTNLFSGIGEASSGLSWGGIAVFAGLGLLLVALVVWMLVGPLRLSRRVASDDSIFEGDVRAAGELRADADSAAASADWTRALLLTFRAIVRSLDERGTISIAAGMTAHEAAIAAGIARHEIAAAISLDADAFDGARYGQLAATEQHYRHAVQTYDSVTATRQRSAAS